MIKAAIFGLGRIGATYDDLDNLEIPRSHLGALINNPIYEIVALIDPDQSTFKPLENHFSKNIFFTDDNLWNGTADVIIFANSPHNREKELNAIIKKSPKVIMLEKPLAADLEQAKKIEELVNGSDVKCVINFHRRYDQNYIALKKQITKPPQKIICRYSKGLYNYASHHIDLVQNWFGDFSNIKILSNAENPDFKADLSCGANIYFLGFKNTKYDIFDMDIFFDDSVLHIENGGCEMRWQRCAPDLYYPNYTQLSQGIDMRKKGQVSGMISLYEDIKNYVLGQSNALLGTTIEESVKNMLVIDEVLRQKANNEE